MAEAQHWVEAIEKEDHSEQNQEKSREK